LKGFWANEEQEKEHLMKRKIITISTLITQLMFKVFQPTSSSNQHNDNGTQQKQHRQ
jgi:peptide methionine sulfoxide reductase MsrA